MFVNSSYLESLPLDWRLYGMLTIYSITSTNEKTKNCLKIKKVDKTTFQSYRSLIPMGERGD